MRLIQRYYVVEGDYTWLVIDLFPKKVMATCQDQSSADQIAQALEAYRAVVHGTNNDNPT